MAGIQNSIANAISGSTVGGGAGPEPPTGDDLLDLYPGATGAYSVRLLRSEYAGAALRVRREDTNEETDIGFDASGNLDTAALIDFCSFTNGLVSVWYDQSGLGVNLVQDAETSQPKIYDVADGVVMDGGRPAMLLDGEDDNIKADITDVSAPVTGFFMRSYQTIGGTYVALGMGGPASSWFDLNNISVFQSFFGTFSSTFPADTEQGLYTAIVDGGSSVVSYNGNEKTTSLPGSLVENICVGSTFGGSFYANIKAQEFIFYPSNESGSKADIEANMAGYFTDVVPLLDTYGGAAAAYSLRRLSSTYTGAPVAVRNGGGVIADIGFDVFGRLDIVELKAHCGATNGTVSTWYDQSGSGNDAVQSDPLAQPKVFDGATGVVLENGEPAVDFDGTNSRLNTTISTISQPFTSFQVVKGDVLDTVAFIYSATSSTVSLLYVNANTIRANAGVNLDSAAIRDTNQTLLSAVFNGASSATYKNGSSIASGNAGTNSLSDLIIGSPSFAAQRFDGKIQELVIFPSDQDTTGSREPIEDNIDKYYGITSEGVLDKYPGAAAAYSLRRLTRAYRGPLITARRTDGQLKDIYATSTGELDVVTLSAWSSGQDATVQVWFDQSGEGNHATQATPTSQPKIYDAATGVIVEGGRSAVSTVPTNSLLLSSSITFNDLSWFTITAKTSEASGSGSMLFYGDSGASFGGDDVDNAGNPRLRASGDQILATSLSNTSASGGEGLQHLSYYNRNGSNASGGLNGEVNAEATVSTAAFNLTELFRGVTSGYYYDGKVQEIILYPSDQSSRRVGIEDDLAEYYNLKEYRLLDRYPGAAAAYSLRLLSTSYLSDPEPYAVRVRRSSDNEEADIGFDGFGNLNVSLLEDFCAGADGFVSRWFDQSGGGNDANQIDEGAQPQLVASGSVIEENVEPALSFNGTGNFLNASTINIAQPTSYFITYKYKDVANFSTTSDLSDGVTRQLNDLDTGQVLRVFAGSSFKSSLVASNNQALRFSLFNGANSALALNGGSAETGNAGTNSIVNMDIGKSGSFYLDAYLQEFVIYPSDQSENRRGIETNIDRHYKIGTLLLDKYPSAAAAYSLRLLSSSYEGPLIEVQRSVDGKTIDIYPDPFGVLDTATLSAFCNGLTGTVRTWYDQSGGGNDATQTDTLKQPKIYGDRTNLLLQSNQFDTTWVSNTANVTSGQIGYDGTNDAWLLNSTGTGFPRIEQTISASGILTLSVYAKAATDGFMLIRTFGADTTVWFDLNNGNIVGSSGAQYVSSKTDNVGNGWYRCSVVLNGSLTSVRFYPASAFGVYSTSGNGIYIQDAQLETGSSATDYIETTTSAVTVSGVVTDNGKPAVEFDGTNDHLLKPITLTDTGDSFVATFITVAQANNPTSDNDSAYPIALYPNVTFIDRRFYELSLENTQTAVRYQGGNTIFNTGDGQAQCVFMAAHINTNSPSVGRLNGSDLTVSSSANVALNMQSDSAIVLGAAGTPTSYTSIPRGMDGKLQEALYYNSDQYTTNRTGIEGDINGFYEIYTPFTTGLLDDYPTAAAAYSLRALSSTYYNGATPYAIEVRRASDGATQNIGFDIEGNLDTTALATFCSGTNGTVQTWYDQSGNGYNATQPDPLAQPTIFTGGAVVTESGKPKIDFDGTNHFLRNTSLTTTQPTSMSVVGVYDSGNGYFLDGDTQGNRQAIFINSSQYAIFAGATLSSGVSVSAGLHTHIYALFNGVTSEVYVNKTGVSSQNAGTAVLNGIYIGQRYDGGFGLDGQIQEIVIWNSNQTSAGNRTGIESNINQHYDIYETGLLAEYPGAAAAYSVRQLRSFYDGPAIRVRRDSDDAELDIGFDENGDLDLVALGDFCKYTDGFVKVWYDQSGNANDATQTTTSAQGKIYDSTSGVYTQGGKPAIEFGLGNLRSMTGSITLSQPMTYYVAAKSESSDGVLERSVFIEDSGNTHSWGIDINGRAFAICPSLIIESTNQTRIDTELFTFVCDGASSAIYTDGNLSVSGDVGSNGLTGTQGVLISRGNRPPAYVHEFVLFDNTSNRTNIESNINDYFDIY